MGSKALYDARRRIGLCGWCGEVVTTTALCVECTGRKERARQAYLARLRARGLCPRCGKRPAPPPLTQCSVCAEKDRDRSLSRYEWTDPVCSHCKRFKARNDPVDFWCWRCLRGWPVAVVREIFDQRRAKGRPPC